MSVFAGRAVIVAAGVVALIAGSASAQQMAADQAAPRERRTTAQTPRLSQNFEGPLAGPQAFSVALVLGDMQGGTAQDNVPPAARKALADVKDFLPYKSYRLLDVQWTLCCGRSPVLSRLRGPDEQEYDLELNPTNASGGKWYVRFTLRAANTPGVWGRGQTAASGEITSLTEQVTAAERQFADLRSRYNDNHPEVARARARLAELSGKLQELRRDQELKRRGAAAGTTGTRAIIDTSFTMDVGETVVVGSSSLKADKALIALLTAVPQRGTAK